MQKGFDKFLTTDNFKLAFDRLKTAPRNLYKSIYYSDLKIFELYLLDNIDNLINSIRENIYKPKKCHKIFIPKKNNLIRPLSMLNFIDLLVYQSIVNVISDDIYDEIAPYYNSILFGNVINTSSSDENDRKFFYKPWKGKWKKFNEKTKTYYEDGYKYLSEFDIASFFDTIDHSILIQILDKTYRIDKELLTLLERCLEIWTGDSNHKTFTSKHGIPQGPISSAFLADIYLLHLDLQLIKMKVLDIKYIRYVDDIRIFSKDKLTAKKAIATLDLLSRDLGLIPQGSKILIKEIVDVDKELRLIKNNFSKINKEYKKKDGELKSKTHKKLKKRFFNTFDEDSEDREMAKTIIGFSLYKMNKDDEVKQKLIQEFDNLSTHIEGILVYFKKHYLHDNDVMELLKKQIEDKDILFHHIVAMIFKNFPHLDFSEEVFERYTFENHRNWLVRYYMIDWLHENSKKELILTMISDNQLIQRKLNDCKFIISEDDTHKKIFAKKLLENKVSLTALQGIFLLFSGFLWFYRIKPKKNHNDFIKNIISDQRINYINHALKEDYQINNSESFFNTSVWNDYKAYEELNGALLAYNKSKDNSPSIAIMRLNFFNHLVFDKICERLNINKPSKDYGGNLDASIISSDLPITNRYWKEINAKRNQKSEAHPYDRYGNLRIRITHEELQEIHNKQIRTLEEICNLNNVKDSFFSSSIVTYSPRSIASTLRRYSAAISSTDLNAGLPSIS